VAVCINKQNFTYELIEQSRIFAISALAKSTPLRFIGGFGFRTGRETNKFEDVNFKIGRTGTRIVLDNSVAYLEAEVTQEIEVDTHTLFIGKVVDADILNGEEPMTYAFYHEVKKGTTPSSAPTYSKTEAVREVRKMDKYKCLICGYVYDPEIGDPDSEIKPGTSFDELPGNWVCPICGAAKDQFEKTE
jgi:rubredoxin/flavin reductase (DIM6/NTAB) family NADH-FMN oxidoreductase RutF